MSTVRSSESKDETRSRPLGEISPNLLPAGQACLEMPPPGFVLFFAFDDHHTGNCFMSRTGVYLYADGGFFFTSFLETSGSSDAWLIKQMNFTDRAGGVVGDFIPQFNSPTISQLTGTCFNKTSAIPNITPAEVMRITSCGWLNHC
jgi:hypothetical protein